MLISWNAKINLVSASTLPQIWTRHFLDSAQLMPFIPEMAQSLADMGSGAGFPGLVLAIMALGIFLGGSVSALAAIDATNSTLKAQARVMALFMIWFSVS